MSRRFGRKRKAKMRGRIADLEKAHEMYLVLLKEQLEKHAETTKKLKHVIDCINQVCPNFIGIPAKTINCCGDMGKPPEFFNLEKIELMPDYVPRDSNIEYQTKISYEQLHRLEVLLEEREVQEKLQKHIHVRVIGWLVEAYYVSRDAWHKGMTDEYVIEQLIHLYKNRKRNKKKN